MGTRQHRYDPELPRLSLCGRAILPRPEQRWGVRGQCQITPLFCHFGD
jgi:hypothetical protein